MKKFHLPGNLNFRKTPTHVIKTKSGIRVCYRCGGTSYKITDCTFGENTTRAYNIHTINDKWIKKNNSLNCLLTACYDIFNTKSLVK